MQNVHVHIRDCSYLQWMQLQFTVTFQSSEILLNYQVALCYAAHGGNSTDAFTMNFMDKLSASIWYQLISTNFTVILFQRYYGL